MKLHGGNVVFDNILCFVFLQERFPHICQIKPPLLKYS